MRITRLFVAIFTALAMTALVNARSAFSQEAADSGTSVDASWERTGPALDEDAETADKVLEIPQASCAKTGAPGPCDTDVDATNTDDDGTQAINAPSPGAPPPTLDEDTANNGTPDPDWGTVNDYQNEPSYTVPYGSYPYPYPVTVAGPSRIPSPVPASAYIPMSSPVTQAARPPLNPGPWMTRPSMSAFGRPAGSPMVMSSPLTGFNH